jgi:uncharacterized protein (TIGR02246 family)
MSFKLADPKLAREIREGGAGYGEAVNKNDAEAVAALFTEDAVQITPDGIFSGRQAIEQRYADAFRQRHPTNHVLKVDQVYVTENNEVFDYGEWSGTFETEGSSYEVKGYWTAIVVREGNVWKTRMSTYNIATKPA